MTTRENMDSTHVKPIVTTSTELGLQQLPGRAERAYKLQHVPVDTNTPVRGNCHPHTNEIRRQSISGSVNFRGPSNVRLETIVELPKRAMPREKKTDKQHMVFTSAASTLSNAGRMSSEISSLIGTNHPNATDTKTVIKNLRTVVDKLQSAQTTQEDMQVRAGRYSKNTEAALSEVIAADVEVDLSVEPPPESEEIPGTLDIEFLLGGSASAYVPPTKKLSKALFHRDMVQYAFAKCLEAQERIGRDLDKKRGEVNDLRASRDILLRQLSRRVESLSGQDIQTLITTFGYSKEMQGRFLGFLKEAIQRKDLAIDARMHLLKEILDLPISWRQTRADAREFVRNYLAELPLVADVDRNTVSTHVEKLTEYLQFAACQSMLIDAVEAYRGAVSNSAETVKMNTQGIENDRTYVQNRRQKLSERVAKFDAISETLCSIPTRLRNEADVTEAGKIMEEIISLKKEISIREERLNQDMALLESGASSAAAGGSSRPSVLAQETKVRDAVKTLRPYLASLPHGDLKKWVLTPISGTLPAEQECIKAITAELQDVISAERTQKKNELLALSMSRRMLMAKDLLEVILADRQTNFLPEGALELGMQKAHELLTGVAAKDGPKSTGQDKAGLTDPMPWPDAKRLLDLTVLEAERGGKTPSEGVLADRMQKVKGALEKMLPEWGGGIETQSGSLSPERLQKAREWLSASSPEQMKAKQLLELLVVAYETWSTVSARAANAVLAHYLLLRPGDLKQSDVKMLTELLNAARDTRIETACNKLIYDCTNSDSWVKEEAGRMAGEELCRDKGLEKLKARVKALQYRDVFVSMAKVLTLPAIMQEFGQERMQKVVRELIDVYGTGNKDNKTSAKDRTSLRKELLNEGARGVSSVFKRRNTIA